ncbi:MAG TPA: hypothetical protein VHM90_10270 [Phycisphaerae bacterium]|jgi:hypothetical protein|nr:hypothetical protein [Phycisphaerae bacterium]
MVPAAEILEQSQAGDGAAIAPTPAYDDLSREVLGEIARERGIDCATRLLFDSVRTHPRHRAFIEAVDSAAAPERCPASAELPRLVVAPGALYREQPRFGSDGRVVRAAAAELGWHSRVIPVKSMGSVTGNAEMIAGELAREERPVVLASVSKGGSDVRMALERHPEIAGRISCWLNICGLIRGTPISDTLLGTGWWQRGLMKGYLAYTRAAPEFVRQMRSGPGTLLAEPMDPAIARRVRIINVVAFPVREHLTGSLGKRHSRMAHLGPNDGTALLRDEIVDPGIIYPVWDTDHFMRRPDLPAVMRRILIHAEAA